MFECDITTNIFSINNTTYNLILLFIVMYFPNKLSAVKILRKNDEKVIRMYIIQITSVCTDVK